MKYFFTLIFLLAGEIVFGQNYAPLVEGRSYLFESYPDDPWKGFHLGFRVDSTWFSNQEQHFLPDSMPMFCHGFMNPVRWNPKHGTTYPWLQKAFSKDSNATYTFYNEFYEPIFLKTKSQPGENWVFYTYPHGIEIHAIHFATKLDSVLGRLDSVKYFQFQAFDTIGNPISNRWNGEKLLLGKENGLIQTIRFECFPRGILDTTFAQLFQLPDTSMVLYQVGATHPDVGTYPLAIRHIHDYEVGDIIISTAWDQISLITYTNILEKRTIRSKVQIGDTVTYTVGQQFWRHRVLRGEEDFKCWEDSTAIIVNLKTPAPLPDIPYRGNWQNADLFSNSNSRWMPYDLKVLFRQYFTTGNPPGSNCQSFFHPNALYYGMEGLGNHFFEILNISIANYNEPFYYKKGNKEWGRKIDFDSLSCTVGIEKEFEKFSIALSPNPAKSQITFAWESQPKVQSLHVYDIWGKKVFASPLPAHTDEFTLDLHAFPQGIYVYYFMEKGRIEASGKFVKK